MTTIVCILGRCQWQQHISTCSLRSVSTCADSRYVNIRHAPEKFDVTSAVVYPHFLSEEQGKCLVKEAANRLKRRRFQDGHWDSVITGYREIEMSIPNEQYLQQHTLYENTGTHDVPQFAKIIQDTQIHLSSNHFNNNEKPNNIQWLPCHAIDLSTKGVLTAHVDSVKFSGAIVAGISLMSDAIMRLRPYIDSEEDTEDKIATDISNENEYVDLYLPQLSLYVLSGMSRYSYTHELLPSGSIFEYNENGEEGEIIDVTRRRRLSLIFRDTKNS